MFWEMIKQKLTQMWVDKSMLTWVDFNNMDDLNNLAKKIMPDIIDKNPKFKQMINNQLSPDQKKEIWI